MKDSICKALKHCIQKLFVLKDYYYWCCLILPLNLFDVIGTSGSLLPSFEEIKK